MVNKYFQSFETHQLSLLCVRFEFYQTCKNIFYCTRDDVIVHEIGFRNILWKRNRITQWKKLDRELGACYSVCRKESERNLRLREKSLEIFKRCECNTEIITFFFLLFLQFSMWRLEKRRCKSPPMELASHKKPSMALPHHFSPPRRARWPSLSAFHGGMWTFSNLTWYSWFA